MDYIHNNLKAKKRLLEEELSHVEYILQHPELISPPTDDHKELNQVPEQTNKGFIEHILKTAKKPLTTSEIFDEYIRITGKLRKRAGFNAAVINAFKKSRNIEKLSAGKYKYRDV